MPFKIYINPPNRRISRIFPFFSGGSAVIILNGPFGKPCRPPIGSQQKPLPGVPFPWEAVLKCLLSPGAQPTGPRRPNPFIKRPFWETGRVGKRFGAALRLHLSGQPLRNLLEGANWIRPDGSGGRHRAVVGRLATLKADCKITCRATARASCLIYRQPG